VGQVFQNFYRFSMDRLVGGTGRRRLVKQVNGVHRELWSDPEPFVPGRSYELVIEAYEDHLVGFLDGVLLFHQVDSGLKAGRVGFYTWGNSSAQFEAHPSRLNRTDLWELDPGPEVCGS
jgi:hypothetical protein